MSWRDFWNGEHAIYVNDRHRTLHYDRIAKDMAALIETPDASVLDHGCGEASSAALVAVKCATLYLYDQAPKVQEKLRLKFSRAAHVNVLSHAALETLPDASLDLVIANSLLQYLTYVECENLLDFWHAKLKPDGRLVLADLIPPDNNPFTDAKALLHFGWQGGFLLPGLSGLVATFFSSYRRLRQQLGLTHYSEQDAATLLAAHGFSCARAERNIGHNQARMCVVARKRADT